MTCCLTGSQCSEWSSGLALVRPRLYYDLHWSVTCSAGKGHYAGLRLTPGQIICVVRRTEHWGMTTATGCNRLRLTTTLTVTLNRKTNPKRNISRSVKVKWICIAPSRETSVALRHGSHSVTCKLHQYLLLPRKRSPDGASPDWDCRHLVVAYYSLIYPERMKGWVGLVGWLIADDLPT